MKFRFELGNSGRFTITKKFLDGAKERGRKRHQAYLEANPERKALAEYLEAYLRKWGKAPSYADTADRFSVSKGVVAGLIHTMRRQRPELRARAPVRRHGHALPAPPRVDDGGCRYIHGDPSTEEPWHYCGAPLCGRPLGHTLVSSYCEEHHARCYQPPKPKPKRSNEDAPRSNT